MDNQDKMLRHYWLRQTRYIILKLGILETVFSASNSLPHNPAAPIGYDPH